MSYLLIRIGRQFQLCLCMDSYLAHLYYSLMIISPKMWFSQIPEVHDLCTTWLLYYLVSKLLEILGFK